VHAMIDIRTASEDASPPLVSRFGKSTLAVIAAAVLSVSFLAACGDDDDVSPEEAFCNAGDDLRSDVDSLSELDLVAQGTDALEEQVTAISDDIDAMKAAGAEVAADEITALETAVDELDSALSAIDGEVTVDNAAGAVVAVSSVASAGQAVYTVLDTTCS
jgi:hypothetical protein